MNWKLVCAFVLATFVGNVHAQALIFNLNTMTLTVPQLVVGTATYGIVLRYDADGRLSITSMTPASTLSGVRTFAGTYTGSGSFTSAGGTASIFLKDAVIDTNGNISCTTTVTLGTASATASCFGTVTGSGGITIQTSSDSNKGTYITGTIDATGFIAARWYSAGTLVPTSFSGQRTTSNAQEQALIFNLNTLTLTIPQLVVGSATYSIVLRYDADGRLSIASLTPA